MLSTMMTAQAPNKMSYQAVIRDASNNLITNTSVGVRVSILQGSSTGTAVYQETHTVTTNINGLVSLEVGAGTVISGTFSSIAWSSGDFYIKTETDPIGGSSYTISGTSQLLSVPYALYAGSSGTGSSTSWTVNGNDQYASTAGNVGLGTNNPENKLHVVGNISLDNGRLEFKNSGASVFVGENAGVNDDLQNNYNTLVGFNAGKLNISGENNVALGAGALENNSTGNSNTAIGRLSLLNNITGSDNVALGLYSGHSNISGSFNTFLGRFSGGNSTGSYNVFLGNGAGENETGNDKLYISNSNTATPLIYGDFFTKKLTINDYLSTKYFQLTSGATNGYILQSDASGNGTWVNPTTLSSNNGVNYIGTSYLGKTSGNGSTGTTEGTSSNLYNIGIGNQVLNANTTGSYNIALGENALKVNLIGDKNVAIGKDALKSVTGKITNTNSSYIGLSFPEVAVGTEALSSNTTNMGNVAIGYQSQQKTNGTFESIEGTLNTSLGTYSLKNNTVGNTNTSIGYYSLIGNTTGDGNTSIGSNSGATNTTGSYNTFIGSSSNATSSNLYNATAIGFNAIVATSNSLVLGGTGANAVSVGIGTTSPTQTLDVVGTTKTTNLQVTNGATNGYVLQSDASGNGTWVNPITLSNGNWTTSGTNQYSALSGNVGIGTSLPSEKLEISGKTKTTNLQVTTGATNGYVLQSDISGNASWVNPSSLTITESDPQVASTTSNYVSKWNGTALVDGIIYDNGNNIGLGTTSPSSKLHVVGSQTLDGGRLEFSNTGNSIFIGTNTGLNDDLTNNNNVFIGYESGKSSTTGNQNTYVGGASGNANVSGGSNATLGFKSLYTNTSGAANTIIGAYSGYNNLTGNRNVFLGYNAGYNETGSDKLYIDNSNTSTPLIYGDFSSNQLNVNGKLTVNSNTASSSTFAVEGSVATTFKTPLVAGTTNPDATGMTWRYTSGSGTITLPAASTCPDRIYVIINQTGSTRTISSYRDLTTNTQTTLGSSVALWLQSDGTDWWQIK